jgi:hypothetical protein
MNTHPPPNRQLDVEEFLGVNYSTKTIGASFAAPC